MRGGTGRRPKAASKTEQEEEAKQNVETEEAGKPKGDRRAASRTGAAAAVMVCRRVRSDTYMIRVAHVRWEADVCKGAGGWAS